MVFYDHDEFIRMVASGIVRIVQGSRGSIARFNLGLVIQYADPGVLSTVLRREYQSRGRIAVFYAYQFSYVMSLLGKAGLVRRERKRDRMVYIIHRDNAREFWLLAHKEPGKAVDYLINLIKKYDE